MRINEYPLSSSFDINDILLKDGVDGTKTIRVEDAAKELQRIGKTIQTEELVEGDAISTLRNGAYFVTGTFKIAPNDTSVITVISPPNLYIVGDGCVKEITDQKMVDYVIENGESTIDAYIKDSTLPEYLATTQEVKDIFGID